MSSTYTETVCREFAEKFDGPNARRGIQLAESGQITWVQLEYVFTKALRRAVAQPTIRLCATCGEREGSQWVTSSCDFSPA